MKTLASLFLLLSTTYALPEQVSSGTELRIRLRETISTESNKTGDRFTATVLSPSKHEGAIVRGRISSIRKSGDVKGSTRMRLQFQRIQFQDGTSAPIAAELVRVYESETENVKKTDEEGTVQSGKQSREALKRGAAGAGVGALIGAIAGGQKGAAIGLIVGGAAGAGSVAVTGKKEIKLEQGTEMLIRTLPR